MKLELVQRQQCGPPSRLRRYGVTDSAVVGRSPGGNRRWLGYACLDVAHAKRERRRLAG